MNTESTQTPESLESPSGSRSSDTPQTSRFIREFDPVPCWEWEGYARRLEGERDAARASLLEIYNAMVRYEGDVDGDAPPEHRRMMDRIRGILFSENDLAMATPTDTENGN